MDHHPQQASEGKKNSRVGMYHPLLPSPTNPSPNNPSRQSHLPHTPPPPSDLPTAISTLTNLLTLSHTTLSLLPPYTYTPTTTSIKPPNYISSSQYYYDQLRYPHTLKLPPNKNPFIKEAVGPEDDDDDELCFSVDEFLDVGFFYQDCPGAVGLDPSPLTFTLPRFLSFECANFSGDNNDKVADIGSFAQKHNFWFLPSELWFIKTEVERWTDYPASYSYGVLRAIICSLNTDKTELLEWVIANSPYYGVVIDVYMRDHIILLFQFCLKAIAREAVNWAELILVKDTMKQNPVAMSFNCPILANAIRWLSVQLSVLYNEVDGKRFVINMLKHWILISSKNKSLFMGQKVDVSTDTNNTEGESVNEEKYSIMDKSGIGENIFVSQVAAAIAALHERALLEEKLKVLSDTKPVPRYQRVAEHEYITKRADEERKRRSDYRPLLEYDGITWHRPNNDQEGNTTKTREELLAEQRDYKRRRMSYRGKKLKRNATEVIRDIIDDCMDSIKQAGGIGCFEKLPEDSGKLLSEPPPSTVNSTDSNELKKKISTSSTVTSDHFNGHKEEFRSHDDKRYARYADKPKHRSRNSCRNYEPRDDQRTAERDRHGREYYSRSVEKERSHGGGHRDDMEHSRTKHSRVWDGGDDLSHDRTNYQRERGNRDSEGKDRRRKYSKRDHRADSVTSCIIEDRYNPYESRDMHEE